MCGNCGTEGDFYVCVGCGLGICDECSNEHQQQRASSGLRRCGMKTNEEIAELLEAVSDMALYIWGQGSYGLTWDERTCMEIDVAQRFCALGLCELVAGQGETETVMVEMLSRAIIQEYGDGRNAGSIRGATIVADWNDARERTCEEVSAVARDAAALMRL